MLKLVFGKSGYGKTEYAFKAIKSLVEQGEENIVLLTPEQYSFVAERRLLNDLGEGGIMSVNYSSFNRMADTVIKEYSKSNLPILSKGAKTILMLRAIEQVKGDLKLFNKNLDALSFVNSMIRICDEMKSCNLKPDEIMSMSSGIENELLKQKMYDISVIMASYQRLIEDKYIDSADEVTILYNLICDKNYFSDKYVFIDGFRGFVAQEYKILELIIKESKGCVITLCTDNPDNNDSFSLFSYVNNSAKIIKKIADKAKVEYKELYLTKNYRANNIDIENVEKYIFSDCSEKTNAENISLYSAKSITDECENAAREIRKLLRNGNRAGDIAIITRNLDTYKEELSSVFRKYEIPFYNDERQSINSQPLVLFIEYLLRCICYSFRSDDILSLAKTGLTQLSYEELNELENYVFLWNINGLKWTKEFSNSTKGFVSEISNSDQLALDKLNESRVKLIEPIVAFKNSIKGKSALEICKQIYFTLIKFNADKKIKEKAIELANLNKIDLADEQGRVWDLVMEILNEMPKALGDEPISIKDFSKIFSLVIKSEDLGNIPVGLDNIQFGQADRIRVDNPKFVFILGANEGVFPQAVSGGGLLSENERRILLDNDFKLYSYSEILNIQEQFFAYKACTSASDKLFVSYIGCGSQNGSPSEIVTSLENIFNIKAKSIADIADIDLIETNQNAFELMSERFLYNNAFYSSLKEYFKDDDRFQKINDLITNTDLKIKDKGLATSLFNYNMYVSASRVEDYYNCAFRYFCKFGINAKPRKKAEIDPMQRGTLIHYVLEMILSSVGSKELSILSDSEIKALVDKYTHEYFVSQMGNADDLTIRFMYNYKRLSKLIYSVVKSLANEFSGCDFEAKAFELSIDNDGQVKPEILNLDDGGTIQIRGSIDRVDTFEKDGERFVRVVDYKSGNKDFSLSDIMSGLNLQMFIYLFNLCNDKNSALSGTPSGVLYMHAARNIFKFDSRSEAGENISKEEESSFKMKGIVLADEDGDIPRAMENELLGKHIPVKLKANGDLTGKLATLEQLGLINKKINQLVSQMGLELHFGNISHNPIKNSHHKTTCDYCDYKDVCANKRLIENRVGLELSDKEVFEELEKEFCKDATVDNTTE